MSAARKRKRRSDEDEDEVQELTDLHVERVDAVTEPATRLPFLIVKAEEEGPSLDELLKKAKEGDDGGGESEREKLHQEQEERSKKYGIGIKEGGHLTPPKGYPTDPEKYGDPVNFRYPIDEEHVRPAVQYFNHDGQREAGDYTEAEWEIIGKRIASAANDLLGDGYKFEGGKIVTPNTEDEKTTTKGEGAVPETVTKQETTAPEVSGVPGSPEWEKQDAALLRQAVQGLLAVKEILVQAKQREEIENAAGQNEWDEVNRLWTALGTLADLIGDVAAAAALEETEAGEGADAGVTASVTKVGRSISAANMEKIKTAMLHLAKVAGCKTIKEFADLYETPSADEDEEAAKGKKGKSEDEDAEKARGKRNPASDEGEDEEGEAEKAKTKKSLADADQQAAVVMKALEATGLTQLAKGAEGLLKAAETIQRLEERVKALEEQPMPGGPVLRGRAAEDYYLVRKGADPVAGANGDLENVLEQVTDPYLRDALSRELAKSLHPAKQK